jgi:Protein of unknown function (DUF2793)
MATEKLGLEEINLSQAAKEISHNTALRQIEGRTIGALSRTTASPPGSPDEGDVYIIPTSGASGEWTGKEDQLAHFYGGVWNYWVPSCPVRLWISDDQVLVLFDGTDWVDLISPSLLPPFTDTTALIKGSVDDTKKARLEVDGLTTATTRVLTVPNKNFTIAGTDDTAAAQAAAAAVASAALAGHVAASDPHTVYQKESEKSAANGYASLDSGGKVPAAELPSSGAGSGTVTSVALTVPAELSVSGSPITSSGTLAVTKANQSANQVFAGPTSGSAAAPAFRALVAADLPAQPYDVGSFLEPAPTASQVVLRHVFARQVIFASGLSPSQGVAGTAATAQTDYDIQKNGSSVGTMRFAAAGTVASFIMASQTTFAAGDKLTVIAAATPDATLAKVSFTLAGTR